MAEPCGRLARVRHESDIREVAEGVTLVDTAMAGQRELNAVYVIAAAEPALIETGPGADGPTVRRALDRLGIGLGDLAHIVVSHIHLDHAGGAGALLRTYHRATLWVHERGAPHLEDPARLVASTVRTQGEKRVRTFYGETLPVPRDRIRTLTGGENISLGDRALNVLHTPGHASHHIALMDEGSGALLTGEALGSHLPWADCYRPALPPPEVDVEQALDSIGRMRAVRPSLLLASHFGPIGHPDEGFDRAAERIRAWAETVRHEVEGRPERAPEDIVPVLRQQARAEFERDSGAPFDAARYDALGSIEMNARGLVRYWRKRWQREADQVT